MIELTLPWPKTVNHYWKHCVRGRAVHTYPSDAAKAYKEEVAVIAAKLRCNQFTGRLSVTLYAHMPDKRKRDLDNLHKGVLDSLTACGVWADDEQIDDLRIIRCGTVKGGQLRVTIKEITK